MAYRFNTYAKIVGHRRPARPDVRYPFHHLSSQKFWTAHLEGGQPSKHRATTEYVLPVAGFLAACRDPQFRREARIILILTHFPDPTERNALYHLLGMPTPPTDEVSRDAFFEKPKDAENVGRTARFRGWPRLLATWVYKRHPFDAIGKEVFHPDRLESQTAPPHNRSS